MMSLGDRLGTECPDKFADPIGYFEWFEGNKCPCCDGKGFRLYNVSNNDPMERECQCCQGSAMRDEDWDCDEFSHDEIQ